MGINDIFFQAAQELLGTDRTLDADGNKSNMRDLLSEVAAAVETEDARVASEEPPPYAEEQTAAPKVADAIPLPLSLAPPRRKTIIAEDALIHGSVEAKGGIELYGEVRGNLSSQEKILISGSLVGDSASQSMEMLHGSMQGNVSAKGLLQIDDASVLLGAVQAGELQLDGKIKGNLLISEIVRLGEHAVVLGNIAAQQLTVEDGAALQGELRIAARNISEAFQ